MSPEVFTVVLQCALNLSLAKQELCKKLDGYDILISEPCLFGPFIYDLHHVQWIMNIWAGK